MINTDFKIYNSGSLRKCIYNLPSKLVCTNPFLSSNSKYPDIHHN